MHRQEKYIVIFISEIELFNCKLHGGISMEIAPSGVKI